MARPTKLYLTADEMIAALEEVAGLTVSRRTMAYWAENGTLEPSVRWDKQKGRYHPRLYAVQDFARLRLIAWLRQEVEMPFPQVRAVLAYLDKKLRTALRYGSDATFSVEGDLGVIVDGLEVPTGQYRLPHLRLGELADEEEIRRAISR